MAVRFIGIAVVYLQVGVAIGFAMDGTHNIESVPLHLGYSLLGWGMQALLAVIGIPAAVIGIPALFLNLPLRFPPARPKNPDDSVRSFPVLHISVWK